MFYIKTVLLNINENVLGISKHKYMFVCLFMIVYAVFMNIFATHFSEHYVKNIDENVIFVLLLFDYLAFIQTSNLSLNKLKVKEY